MGVFTTLHSLQHGGRLDKLQHGSNDRPVQVHCGGELRGVPQGAERWLHVAQGGARLQPCHDHNGGGRQVDHDHQDDNEEFEEETTDGRRCKTTVTMDGNKLITSQKATKSGEKDVVAVREFSDAGLTLTTTCDGVTAVQTFVRA